MPPYRITHSTFNGETLWAVEKWQPEVQDYGIVQIFTTQAQAEERYKILSSNGKYKPKGPLFKRRKTKEEQNAEFARIFTPKTREEWMNETKEFAEKCIAFKRSK